MQKRESRFFALLIGGGWNAVEFFGEAAFPATTLSTFAEKIELITQASLSETR